MITTTPTPKPTLSGGRKILILLIIGTGLAVGIGAMVAQQPLWVLGGIMLVILGMATMVWPDAPTLAVLLILWTNAASVAVRFHGLPFILGAAFTVLLVIPLAYYLIIRREKLIINSVMPLLLLFLAFMVFGTIFAKRIDVATERVSSFIVEGLALYILILNTVRTEKMLRLATWTLVIAGLIIGGLSFYQQATQTFDNNYWGFAQTSAAAFGTGEINIAGEVIQPRLAGSIGEQNRYAQTMLMILPLAFFRVFSEKSRWLRILAGVSVLFISLGILLAFSRGSAIGFILMLIIVAFMRYIKLYQILIIIVGIVLVLQIVPEYATRLSSLEIFSQLFSGDGGFDVSEADGSTKSRLTEMAAAGLVFADYPVVGVGPGNFRYYYREYAEIVGLKVAKSTRESHSLIPGLAAENGGLGLFVYLAIMFVALRDLARARRKTLITRPDLSNMATGYLLSIIAYLTTGIFLHYGYERFSWSMIALAGVAAYVALNQSEPTEEDKEVQLVS